MADLLSEFLAEDLERKVASGSRARAVPARTNTANLGLSTPSSIPRPLPKIDDGSIKVAYRIGSRGQLMNLVIPKLHITPQTFLGRSLILYGLSGSGKTVLLNHILYVMRHLFPIVFIVCPTNSQNHSYDDVAPPGLIYEKPTLDLVKSIYARQKMVVNCYNLANNIDNLKALYSYICSTPDEQERSRLERQFQKDLEELSRSGLGVGELKNRQKDLQKKFEDGLKHFYKTRIETHKERLKNRNLTPEQHLILTYLWVNPRALLVCDDCGTELNALVALGKKEKDDVISNFFFKGRHAGMTHFYVFQDDKGLDSGIRKNAFYSIFTSKQVALAYFERTANNFTKEQKAEAIAAIEAVLGKSLDESGKPNHRKLIYSRETTPNFNYVLAEEHESFQMCGDAIRRYCEYVKNNDQGVDKTNPFYRNFYDVAKPGNN